MKETPKSNHIRTSKINISALPYLFIAPWNTEHSVLNRKMYKVYPEKTTNEVKIDLEDDSGYIWVGGEGSICDFVALTCFNLVVEGGEMDAVIIGGNNGPVVAGFVLL